MRIPRSISFGIPLGLLVFIFAALACHGDGAAKDPLAAELDHWSAFLQSKPDTDQLWSQTKQSAQPTLELAGEDLHNGRRLLALQHLTEARTDLAQAIYLSERTAEQRKDMAAFDAEWTRMGSVLHDDLGTPSPTELAGLPAAVRAMAEAELPQVREYYQASRDYGHNTAPGAGLYYLGSAQAERDLVAFYRTLTTPSPKAAPALRSIGPEIDALQAEMTAAYRPPLSVDSHPQFIAASSKLKEARELDAAGLRFGALLRYLQAAQRFAELRPPGPVLAADQLTKQLHDFAARLSAGKVDHSLGQLFLENAQSEAARATPGSASVTAALIANDVLPRYFAALEPAKPKAPVVAAQGPQVTVTLVRWPYT